MDIKSPRPRRALQEFVIQAITGSYGRYYRGYRQNSVLSGIWKYLIHSEKDSMNVLEGTMEINTTARNMIEQPGKLVRAGFGSRERKRHESCLYDVPVPTHRPAWKCFRSSGKRN